MQHPDGHAQLVQHAAQHRLLAQSPLQRHSLAIIKLAVDIGREQFQICIIQLWVRIYRHFSVRVFRTAHSMYGITDYALSMSQVISLALMTVARRQEFPSLQHLTQARAPTAQARLDSAEISVGDLRDLFV